MKSVRFSLYHFMVVGAAGWLALGCFQKINAVEALQRPSQESTDMQQRIQAFLDEENPNLSKEFPFALNLFKDGQVAKNDAGVRISETPDQFPQLEKSPPTELSGLLFYYQLFDQAMRVPHWHANAVEIGVVLQGNMRITIWDGPGNASVFTVGSGGAWMIPQASVHCLENVGTDELDFIVAYNSGYAEDRDFSTAWAALPSKILEKSLGLSPEDIKTLKSTEKNRLSLYDKDATPISSEIPSPYHVQFSELRNIYHSSLGSIKRADETNWPAMRSMAIQRTMMNPGTIREPHWYSSSDVLFFVKNGRAFFNLMDSNGVVYKTILEAGDLVFIPIGTFHTYVNIGADVLEIYEAFTSSSPLKEISILTASQHFRPGTLSGATGLSQDSILKLKKIEGGPTPLWFMTSL